MTAIQFNLSDWDTKRFENGVIITIKDDKHELSMELTPEKNKMIVGFIERNKNLIEHIPLTLDLKDTASKLGFNSETIVLKENFKKTTK